MPDRVCMCGGGDLRSSVSQVFQASALLTWLPSQLASILASNLASSLLTFIAEQRETTVRNLWCPASSSFKQVPAEPRNGKQTQMLDCSTSTQPAITMLFLENATSLKKEGQEMYLKKKKNSSETSEHSAVAWKCLWAGRRDMHNPAKAHLVSLRRAHRAHRAEQMLPDNSINRAEK